MPSKPQSVCEVNSIEAVVSLENRTMYFVSTKNRLGLTRSLKFDHGCRGIAVVDDQLVICKSGRKIYVYKMNGDRLKAIEKDRSGNDIFGHIREISARNGIIYMADNAKGPVGIDTDGNVIWVFWPRSERPCQDIHYIPEYVETTKLAKNIRKINDEIDKAISEMDNLMKKKQKDIEDNRKTKANFLKEITSFRTEINEALDRLEQASVAEVEGKCSKQDQEFRAELKNIQDTLDKLTTCKAEMESSQRNPSQQFVNTKISENIISGIKEAGSRSTDKVKGNLLFERNSEILHFLQNYESLAKMPLPIKPGLYEVQSKQNYNVKLNDDISTSNIWSSCILDSGDILLADDNNKNIKLIDCESYKVRDSMKMSASLQSVCRISSVEAAVSLYNTNSNTAQFVSTKNKLAPTRSLKFDHGCRGIVVMDGQLVICHSTKAYIYTINGERLKTIEKDRSGNNMFCQIREICLSDNGKTIHMVDDTNGLITIDRDGNVIWKYSGQELMDAWGVCTDGNGNVFVSGGLSRNVIQLGPDGAFVGEVVSQANGLKCPSAVSFGRKKCSVIEQKG
ncbi:uncharacterized protein LOC128549963 [Mercenaria mercenaria]|uniref:uncharacterized protein LOC128549963 n=1 Tax=Mercenaria mercenaria TaxID=6596 RepID=UPI00234EDA86|nr:uncharacterized protein LOC128549963 [Mercenaria mercenaria]